MVLRSVPASADIGSLRMWHVTLTVSGESQPIDHVRQALERLSHAHPFLLEARYGNDRAELRYWEEADDMDAAVAIASAMWGANQLAEHGHAGGVVNFFAEETCHHHLAD